MSMSRSVCVLSILISINLAFATHATGDEAPTLETGWTNPPNEARLRAYWWWLNGNVDKAAITRDLEQMKAKGFGGTVIFDAGGASQDGNGEVPAGPTFFSEAWRDLYRHCLREAHRLGLEISLNIQSGWNVGGPMVKPEDAVKRLVWSETTVQGPGQVTAQLAQPEGREGFYQDVRVVAYPLRSDLDPNRPKIKNWKVKALYEAVQFSGRNGWFLTNSTPDTSVLLEPENATAGEEDTKATEVLDLTDRLGSDGILKWDAPVGRWQVLRLGCTLADKCHTSTYSQGWSGYALDVLDRDAFRRYWEAVVQPLIEDAGPLAGQTLRYLHTDSWEIGVFNWTPTLIKEFKERRGYDPVPFLPVMAGRIVDGRDISNRFLHDFRKTLGDLAVDNHYGPMRDWAARYNIGIHPESGGPHFTPIDAQRCLGMDTVPMSEFWANSATHRVDDIVRFFVKQPASAAHVYGHPIVAAEGFTTVGPHWQETLWDNLKPSFDYACCEGLNRLVWHAFVCSPASMGIPGQQYFAGTHLNPLVTWWSRSEPFFAYINRCQWMLQQGLFVADVCYYYGDHVPNYAQLRTSDPAKLGPGYDYDVITEDAILNRLSCRDGRLVLPDGMSYRMLALASHESISLPVLRRLGELVQAGATVVGARPLAASGLTGYPSSDTEVKRLAETLWTDTGILDRPALEVLRDKGIAPDFEVTGTVDPQALIHAIHRRDRDTDIYFVASRGARPELILAAFRVADKAPEVWDPVTGERRFATDYALREGRTTVPLELGPYGSVFVVFREPADRHPASGQPNAKRFVTRLQVTGPWTVRFDPKWGGPESAEFRSLVSWTDRPEGGIRYYSGTATYEKTLALPAELAGKDLWLDLGQVHELAEVRVNGRSLGIVWAPPLRVDLSGVLRAGDSRLEIDVVNFWPNRIIGDAVLPPAERRTQTNVRKLTANTPLVPSGLLGPVVILERTGP